MANDDFGPGNGEETNSGKSGDSLTEQLSRRKAGVLLTMAAAKTLLMLENFIGGKFLPSHSYIDSYDPSTGEVYCRVPNSGKEEVSLSTYRRLKCV